MNVHLHTECGSSSSANLYVPHTSSNSFYIAAPMVCNFLPSTICSFQTVNPNFTEKDEWCMGKCEVCSWRRPTARTSTCVCPLTYSTPTSPDFCTCMSLMAVARSFLGGVAILYVFPVLWMTSCFPVVALVCVM